MTRGQLIIACLQRLNTLYGRGDVRNVKVYLDGRIEWTRQPYGLKTETRHGRIVGDTVFALGHQQTIGRLPNSHLD